MKNAGKEKNKNSKLGKLKKTPHASHDISRE